jgi:hypothetical protein
MRSAHVGQVPKYSSFASPVNSDSGLLTSETRSSRKMLYDLIAPLEEQDNTLIISAAVEQQITAHIRTFNGKFQGDKK